MAIWTRGEIKHPSHNQSGAKEICYRCNKSFNADGIRGQEFCSKCQNNKPKYEILVQGRGIEELKLIGECNSSRCAAIITYLEKDAENRDNIGSYITCPSCRETKIHGHSITTDYGRAMLKRAHERNPSLST